MGRYTVPTLFVVAFVGSILAVAAAPRTATDVPTVAGKWVIVSMKQTEYFGPKEGVRFETVGPQAFVVVPMTAPNKEGNYDEWVPLDAVYRIRVFDSKEAATALDRRIAPRPRERSEANESPTESRN